MAVHGANLCMAFSRLRPRTQVIRALKIVTIRVWELVTTTLGLNVTPIGARDFPRDADPISHHYPHFESLHFLL